jgi:acyl carrier protein
MSERIRAILQEHARLGVPVASLADDSDLYRAGMTSHASVNVMLALEDEFAVEFPDRMLRRDVFASISAIRVAIMELESDRASLGAGGDE